MSAHRDDRAESSSLVGTTAVLLGQEYAYTATALLRSSLRCIPAKVFSGLAQTNSQFSWRLNLFLSLSIVNQRKRLEANSCLPARDRLEGILLELIQDRESDELQDPQEFLVPLKSQELAEFIAVSPEHLSRVLKEMKEEGVITRRKELLYVTDSAALLKKAAHPEIHRLL